MRLSENFFLRDFLHSEIADFYGCRTFRTIRNWRSPPARDCAKNCWSRLQRTFGRLHIRSGYRSRAVNEFGNRNKLNCSTNAASAADHIWDMRDAEAAWVRRPAWSCHGSGTGAQHVGGWQALAWWIHDHLPYASLCFFPKLWAVNIQWHERPAGASAAMRRRPGF